MQIGERKRNKFFIIKIQCVPDRERERKFNFIFQFFLLECAPNRERKFNYILIL